MLGLFFDDLGSLGLGVLRFTRDGFFGCVIDFFLVGDSWFFRGFFFLGVWGKEFMGFI